MKSLSELTETEEMKLRLAQIRLREAALSLALRPKDELSLPMIYCAANEFGILLRELGMDDYWVIEWDNRWKCDADKTP